MTQNDLANRSGLSLGGVRDLEQHRVKHPHSSTLRRLASALQLSDQENGELVRRGQEVPLMSGSLQICVLGVMVIRLDGEIQDLRSEPQRKVLAVLAISPGVPIGISALSEVLWGQEQPATADYLIRAHLSRLRRKLQSSRDPSGTSGILKSTPRGYMLTVGEDQIDHLKYQRVLHLARAEVGVGRFPEAMHAYESALKLWRGFPLEDLPDLHTQPAAGALIRDHEAMVLEYAETASRLGQQTRSLPALRRLAEMSPLHELAHASLISALGETGQTAAALQVFQDVRTRLSIELGLDPTPELQQAHKAVLTGRVEPLPVSDSMSSELPNLSRPVQARPTQLPPAPRGFVGRQASMKLLDAIVQRTYDPSGGLSIAALCGAPGTGKTTLALHWAQRVRSEFPDGQLFADLGASTSLRSSTAVLRGFLRALGVDPSQVPDDVTDQSSIFRSAVSGKRVLIVLDDVDDANAIRHLLPGESSCMVLVTSRHSMSDLVAFEAAQFVSVDPLSREEAYTLLNHRLGRRRLVREPEAVDRILDWCLGLPSAVAIASAQIATRPDSTLEAFADVDLARMARASHGGEA